MFSLINKIYQKVKTFGFLCAMLFGRIEILFVWFCISTIPGLILVFLGIWIGFFGCLNIGATYINILAFLFVGELIASIVTFLFLLSFKSCVIFFEILLGKVFLQKYFSLNYKLFLMKGLIYIFFIILFLSVIDLLTFLSNLNTYNVMLENISNEYLSKAEFYQSLAKIHPGLPEFDCDQIHLNKMIYDMRSLMDVPVYGFITSSACFFS